MIGGTSGSETKLCQPSASQSKSTQTRSCSFGSRKTVAPLEPYCLRFSAPLVEKMLRKQSKSSTSFVAKINFLLLCVLGAAGRRRWCSECATPDGQAEWGECPTRRERGRARRPTASPRRGCERRPSRRRAERGFRPF